MLLWFLLRKRCGARIRIQVFTQTLGWVPVHKKCGPVRDRNSLDAQLGGCGMLMASVNQWINKSMHEQ